MQRRITHDRGSSWIMIRVVVTPLLTILQWIKHLVCHRPNDDPMISLRGCRTSVRPVRGRNVNIIIVFVLMTMVMMMMMMFLLDLLFS